MKKRVFLFLLSFVLLFSCASFSLATVVRPSSLEDMTDKSDTVVIGTVLNQFSYFEDKMIYTGVRVQVSEYVKSVDPENPSIIELKILGGQVGNVRLEIDQAPIFKDGDEVLLFLLKANGAYTTFGLFYGVHHIIPAKNNKPKQVTGPIFNNRQIYQKGSKNFIFNTLAPDGENLGRFVDRIKQLKMRK